MQRRIQSFLLRPAAERWLVLRTWLVLMVVRAALAVSSYPRVRAWFERRNARASAAPSVRPSRSALAWAVRTAGRYVPSSRPCLTQALVLDSYLRLSGYPSRIAIGVARTPAGTLEAHAWVESDGEVVLGGEDRSRFAELRTNADLRSTSPPDPPRDPRLPSNAKLRSAPMPEPARLKLCLFGAAGDTGNLGVSALLNATLGALAQRAPRALVTVFDNGWGVRRAAARCGAGDFEYRLCGARLSRRLHRPESYWNMRLAARLRGLGNPGARAILQADAVWDLSAGDSFSDLYGPKVLAAILSPKELALERGVPLVLLPQTYGPFRSQEARERARAILHRTSLAWARDERSFAALQELVGDGFDPARHRLGVDVAFLLEPRPPARLGEAAEWLAAGGDAPAVGLNVSGLIYNDSRAGERYGHRADYRQAVRGLLARLLRESDARVLLVPHVLAPAGAVESDPEACRALAETLTSAERERVRLLPSSLDESETKWVLGRLDWFCGTRMHACIGALSSGTPTASIAYSLKTKGVFETCDQGEAVAELQSQDTDEVIDVVWRAWTDRVRARTRLAGRLPAVVRQAWEQIDVTLARSAGALARSTRASPR